MFTGISYFRELALYYQKHGEYPYQDEYTKIFNEINRGNKSKTPINVSFDMFSYSMQDFATHYIDLAVNGDSHGNVHLTGEHFFYLNNLQIARVIKDNPRAKKGRRVNFFADFWDEDWRYFWACEIAQNGLPEGKEFETYDELCKTMDLELVRDLDNLQGGLDVVWGKSRGVGASWKGGAKAAHNLFLVKDSNTFIFAENSAYLLGDGIIDKFDSIRSFVQGNCWWLRKQFSKESKSDVEWSTGYKDASGGGNIIKGFNSNVIGLTIDGDASKGRGKRGDILWEEFGSFPTAEETWGISDASVDEGGVIYGQRRGFGTGGDTGGDFEFLQKMFDNPKSYRLLRCKDASSEFEAEIPFFSPRNRNIAHIDANGNTNRETADAVYKKIQEDLIKNNDTLRAIRQLAEFPEKPSDMFLDVETTILPKALAKRHFDFLKQTNLDRQICSYGTLRKGLSGGIIFEPQQVLPYETYPIPKGENELKVGCVQIVHKPYKDPRTGRVPNGLYLISVDAFAQDESSDSDSIASIRVFEQANRYTKSKGDMFVANLNTRPHGKNSLNEVAKLTYYLAEYYNAKILLENDQVGDFVSYAKTYRDTRGRRLTMYLEEQPDLDFNEDIKTKAKMKRQFGINMTNTRKLQGLKYYADHLEKERGKNMDGKIIYNVDKEFDRGVLQEIIKFKIKKNADRISSSVIMMYFVKDEEFKFAKKLLGSQSKLLNLDNIKLF